MVVTEVATKEIISTTSAVITSSPANVRHRASTVSPEDTVNTDPSTFPVVGLTTDTPPTNRLLS